ncbi:hypothetical protein SLNHY_1382 [Streptomyces albus]|nr:hypothetical protein SLNHY_1382 [Streptomyces albus]
MPAPTVDGVRARRRRRTATSNHDGQHSGTTRRASPWPRERRRHRPDRGVVSQPTQRYEQPSDRPLALTTDATGSAYAHGRLDGCAISSTRTPTTPQAASRAGSAQEPVPGVLVVQPPLRRTHG